MARHFLLLVLLSFSLFAADVPVPPADLTEPPADAQRAENGLVTKELAPGTGTVRPAKDSLLRMRFTVWKSDKTLVQHVAAPTTVVLGVPKMIPGWGEAVQQMVVGAKQRAWVPETLTTGKSKLPMIIDTELVEIIEPPTTPPDVAAAPADAIKSKSGLASIVLRPGTGTVHPRRRDRVAVHYSGWTKDGRMFESSVMKGEPVEFGLDQVIQGWTEGLQLMVEGEKRRFWIPSRMAYGNQRGMPQGNLVFDVELVEIKK